MALKTCGDMEDEEYRVSKVDIGSVQALAETLGTEYFCYCVQKEQPHSCLSQQVKKAETACKQERIQRQPPSVAEILNAKSFGLSLYRPYIHLGCILQDCENANFKCSFNGGQEIKICCMDH